jgi:hypothetical protein
MDNHTKKINYFSIRGLFAMLFTLILGYILVVFIQIINEAEKRYDDNLLFYLFVELIKDNSEKGPDFVVTAYQNMVSFIYIIFISCVLKFGISIKHTFFSPNNNDKYILYLSIFEVVLLGLFFGFDPIKDYLLSSLIIIIPGFIQYRLLDEY